MTERNAIVPLTLPDGRGFRLILDANAMCDYERVMAAAGFDPMAALDQFEGARGPVFSATRALFWASAQTHHPDLTLRQAGDIAGAHPAAVGAAVGVCLQRAMPVPDGDGAEKPTPPNP